MLQDDNGPDAPPAHADHGLAADLPALTRLAARRRWLRAFGGAVLAGGTGVGGLLSLAGCGGGDDADAGSSGDTGSGGSGGTTSCSVIPTETAGPYPADGSLASNQRLNALVLAGIARRDIRTSVGSASGTAPGVPLTVTITLVDTNGSCAALAGRAIYLWHCTRDGGYSLYSSGHTGENYLRGVQVTDANGQCTFTTIFPGCYSGRWPHIHFEVYPSLAAATDATTVSDYAKVSQMALPEAAARSVYGSATGYTSSLSNLNAITLTTDNIFSDGYATQMPSVSGSVADGYTAALTVGIAA